MRGLKPPNSTQVLLYFFGFANKEKRKSLKAKLEQFAALTVIALRSREARLALAAEGAPLAVTAPP